ncbi:MAG TPA: dihydropteroate synthase, partial [Dehalococcoidales bacterium]|nr:dihydropteroate synthase [Dehalococcoidales bacterium]
KDADFIRNEAKSQAEAGARYIDVNAGSFVGQETEYLCWLVEVVQGATDLPLCLDSPDPAAIAAALKLVKKPCMINSITMEKQRLDGLLPLIKQYGTRIVVLCQSDAGMAHTVEEKVDIAGKMVDILTGEGVAVGDIFIDPLIYPIATDTRSAVAALGAIREITARMPEVHTICGLTNVSYGLPVRKLINRTFLVAAMAQGLDSAIIDPTDRELMAGLVAAETILDRDKFCAGYITAYRQGKLS